MVKTQNKLFGFCLVTFVCFCLFCSGCGLISLAGTPSNAERKIKAQYPIASKNEKILVLVDQPGWLSAPLILRDRVSERINSSLVQLAKVNSNKVVPYRTLSDFRSKREDFSLMSPVEAAKLLGADVLLLVQLDAYSLTNMEETNYFSGSLGAHVVLIETKTGTQLWPKEGKAKNILTGYEVARTDTEGALGRLANSLAHCVTRYFYDCPYKKFKIADDRTDAGTENWDNPQF